MPNDKDIFLLQVLLCIINKTPVMENIPASINLFFLLTVVCAVWLIYSATGRSKIVLFVVAAWILIQSLLAASGFYRHPESHPARFILLVLPPVLCALVLVLTPFGKKFRENCALNGLVLFHLIRIPVEVILFLLFLQKKVPALMTFEHGNLDILSGISAVGIFFLLTTKKKLPTWIFLGWNFLCLALLGNIVIRAILSSPLPLQSLAFDQPNIAIFYFPFNLLPGFLVPAVLLCHLVTIRKILNKEKPDMKTQQIIFTK